MTITIYGAGAIGGVTGAALARAGHDVTTGESVPSPAEVRILDGGPTGR